MRDRIDQSAVGLRRGDKFEQAHVARRIEKVRSKPRPAEVVREAFCNLTYRQTASVSGDNRPGLSDGLDFFQQRAFDCEILDHGLDDPVDIGQLLQIVCEVANADQTSEGRLHESCGLGLLGRVKSGGCDLISHGRIPTGNNIRGDDVEQVAGNTSVGEVGGDACAHGSGSEDGNFINALHHLVTLKFPLLMA